MSFGRGENYRYPAPLPKLSAAAQLRDIAEALQLVPDDVWADLDAHDITRVMQFLMSKGYRCPLAYVRAGWSGMTYRFAGTKRIDAWARKLKAEEWPKCAKNYPLPQPEPSPPATSFVTTK